MIWAQKTQKTQIKVSLLVYLTLPEHGVSRPVVWTSEEWVNLFIKTSLMKHHQFLHNKNLSRWVVSGTYMFNATFVWNLSWNHHVFYQKKRVQCVEAKYWIISIGATDNGWLPKKHVFEGSDASKSLGFMLFLGVYKYKYLWFFALNRGSLFTFSRSFVWGCYINLWIGIMVILVYEMVGLGSWTAMNSQATSIQHPNRCHLWWFWRKFRGPTLMCNW